MFFAKHLKIKKFDFWHFSWSEELVHQVFLELFAISED
ncbi:hypothetical protein AALB_2733 [Agarivorans albus MKT 106]|uniref:Uncharacterized protein n=1 Tax=Agarivorans albus MKT 106 TaxID=1331007 RepID=R9PN00_AGAAL|nr:hypothetical protein AALB_2733 [Agarivorans albus MKT 106]